MISTHTPARGVTGFLEALKGTAVISTHTPARGVTNQAAEEKLYNNDFYSHAREGRDLSHRELFHLLEQFLLTRPRGA